MIDHGHATSLDTCRTREKKKGILASVLPSTGDKVNEKYNKKFNDHVVVFHPQMEAMWG